MSRPTRADICIVELAEAFRGDGEILAHPIGLIPTLAARLAKATFEPELMLGCGEAVVGSDGPGAGGVVVESYLPMRRVFDVVWSGHRHVIMGASQLDIYGNQNIAAIGTDYAAPEVQLIGYRGAPGNTINHTTSYWIPVQSDRVMVPDVDVVCGVGCRRAGSLDARAACSHEIRRVVTDLATFDFSTTDHRMRLRSIHPGTTLEQVLEATGFEPTITDPVVPSTPLPSQAQVQIIDALDPAGARHHQVGARSA